MIHIISCFFPGYHGSGGMHDINILKKKFNFENYTWHIGWQKYQLPGMEPDKLETDKLGIDTKSIKIYPLPHVMTPAKVYSFLLSKIPENARVLYYDLKICELKVLEDFDISVDVGSNYGGRIYLKNNSEEKEHFSKQTLFVFKNNFKTTLKIEGEVFVSFHDDAESELDLIHAYRFPVTHEELAIVEFWQSKLKSKDPWVNVFGVCLNKLGAVITAAV